MLQGMYTIDIPQYHNYVCLCTFLFLWTWYSGVDLGKKKWIEINIKTKKKHFGKK